jgi:hypothetical protein
MILNQFGRRNLSNYQRSVLALLVRRVCLEKSKGEKKKGKTTIQKSDDLKDS